MAVTLGGFFGSDTTDMLLVVRRRCSVHAAGASDLVLRNVNSGQIEVYDIANNQIIGAAT
jgi:hypothetical protein